jgi:hypothetical protein
LFSYNQLISQQLIYVQKHLHTFTSFQAQFSQGK